MFRNREQEDPLVIQAENTVLCEKHIFKQSIDVGNLAGGIARKNALFLIGQPHSKNFVKLLCL